MAKGQGLIDHPPRTVMIAIFLGYLTLRNQTRIGRARLTFTTLNHNNWDQDYIANRSAFVEVREAGNVILYATNHRSDAGLDSLLQGQWGGISRDEFKKRQSIIRSILNNHENLAIGIRRGILDEEYLYRFMRYRCRGLAKNEPVRGHASSKRRRISFSMRSLRGWAPSGRAISHILTNQNQCRSYRDNPYSITQCCLFAQWKVLVSHFACHRIARSYSR
jgi:hypothetical protein